MKWIRGRARAVVELFSSLIIINLILPLLIVVLAYPSESEAKDLGQYGATFEVKEEGFLTMIYRKLASLDLKKAEQQMKKLARARVDEPVAVEGLVRAEEARVFYYDPTYVLDKDVYLPDGEILYLKGTKINPLDHLPMKKRLVFIDGNDEEQIKWFKEMGKKQDKLVLVAGRPLELEEALKREVYFDQSGTLIKRFGINQVPAMVEHEGKNHRVLKVSEVLPGS